MNWLKGVPHPDGFGLPEEMSDGIELCGKYQMEMPFEVHSVAYTPPPLALKPVPYVSELLAFIEQP